MSPLNRGPLMGPRVPPPIPPPFMRGPVPGMRPRVPPPHPMGNPLLGPRQRPMPPRLPMGRAGGPPPMFGPRGPPHMMMPPRGMGPCGPMIRPGMRGPPPPQPLLHMRPRFPPNHIIGKPNKPNNGVKRVNKQAHLYENDESIEEGDEGESLPEGESREISLNTNEIRSLYCEVCDREFVSQDQLNKHIAEHRVCNINGCTFSAHTKIVDKHIAMQHRTGLYERMKSVMTDNDIEKWKLERKKRYPTAARVECKEREELEKQKRGEIIQFQRNGRNESNNNRDKRGKNRKRKRTRPGQDRRSQNIEDKNENTASIETKENPEKSLIEAPYTEIEKAPDMPPALPGLSLVADYGISSDEEPPEELPNKVFKPEEETQENSTSNVGKTDPPTTESPTECNKVENAENLKEVELSKPQTPANLVHKDTKPQDKENRRSNPRNNQRNNKNQIQNTGKGKLRLLQRLLARSIQHERNAICQCITYIAKKNFFT